ncbi:hypothetical protein BM536_002520 [Streptomyces phaeoluteigriseus]|uniref:Uncharacterized protein n=1 Tax=Streptomyces phaeoluteigriseus TaxID=114686 RepID=A0A1V6MYS9_9ACTN|nr:hypothetical protein [Streptomyces phaeoluteigriseus]OQD57618.1 hypothetical protein BM536_002520 [Streptomyces phaeoluteigriseus]
MTSRKSLWAAAAALAAGAVVVRRSTVRPADPAAADRWLTVTINRGPGDIQPDRLPAPLQEYGDRIETRIRPAPGDRGTELAVRLRQTRSGTSDSVPARLAGQDPRQDLRRALREAKSLLEAGEVLLPDAPPTTHDTPGGKLVGLLTRRAGGEGVL